MNKGKINKALRDKMFSAANHKVKISHWITAEAKKELKDAAYSEGIGEGEYLSQLIMIAKEARQSIG